MFMKKIDWLQIGGKTLEGNGICHNGGKRSRGSEDRRKDVSCVFDAAAEHSGEQT